MKPHQLRVIEEQKDLQIKLDKLRDFLEKGKPENIDSNEWYLLDKQFGAMCKYNEILKERIFWFNTPSDSDNG